LSSVWEAEIWGYYQQTYIVIEFEVPTEYELDQNYPNPFNPTTSITFSLAEDSRVRIAVYNLLDEQVTGFVNPEFTICWLQLRLRLTNLIREYNYIEW